MCSAITHPLTCNMIYLGHYVSPHHLDLRSNFVLNFFEGHYYCIYFDALRRVKHHDVQIMSLAFLVQKLFRKKNIFPKVAILTSLDLYCLIC